MELEWVVGTRWERSTRRSLHNRMGNPQDWGLGWHPVPVVDLDSYKDLLAHRRGIPTPVPLDRESVLDLDWDSGSELAMVKERR